MLRKIISLAIIGAACYAPAAMAEWQGGEHMDHEKFRQMSAEERQKFFEERDAKWKALSDKEKISLIEQRRAERRKAMDEKWSAMSDSQKLEFVEKKMQHRRERFMQHQATEQNNDVSKQLQ